VFTILVILIPDVFSIEKALLENMGMCPIDYREYQTAKEIDDEDLKSIGLARDSFHGEWNYIISPMVGISISL
jgi:hypothetical protein